jgi:DNA repair protein RadC
MPSTLCHEPPIHLRDAGAVAAHFADLGPLPREVLAIAGLDHRGRLLCERRLPGHAFGVVASPIALLPTVLTAGAVACVLIHNHPSGRLAPSLADLAFTERFQQAAEVCGVQLLDHVIVAAAGWVSLREAGWLELS